MYEWKLGNITSKIKRTRAERELKNLNLSLKT